RRADVPALLRRDRLLYRLHRGREGLHGGGAGRDRFAPRRATGRLADRPHRDFLVGLFQRSVQGRRGVLHPGDRAYLPADRHSRPRGRGEGMSATNIAHSGIDTEGSSRLLRQAPRRPPAYSALRDAFLSALVALGLFGPMIGLKTNAGDRGLFLTTRPLAVAIAV